MLLGVLRAPYEYHDMQPIEILQLIGRAREAADRIEADAIALQEARDKIAALEAEIKLVTLKWKRAHEVVDSALPFWSGNETLDDREYLGNAMDAYYNAPY